MRPTFVTIRFRPWIVLIIFLCATAVVTVFHNTARAPGSERTLGPLSDMRIVVDPGHGGVDGGCNRIGFFEKDLNLAVGKLLHSDLIQKGASAQITRTTDEAMIPWGTPGGSRHQRDLAARIQVARDFQANAFISLHANAGPAHLGGALTFYRKGDAESKRLAALIQEQLSKLVPGNQNGILPAKFMVLTKLDVPAVLIEMGFITNPSDQAFLTSPTAPSALAQEIASGVEAFARGEVPAAPTFSPFPVPSGDDPDWSSEAPYPGCSVNQSLIASGTP